MGESSKWREASAAVIPCFNEESGLPAVVAGVRNFVPTVYVVDDGSTDGTGRIAEAAGARVLRQPERRGKGAALRRGLDQARSDGFRWGLTLDGDGQHAPEDIPKFFEAAERGAGALIVGNRMWQEERMPWLRRWTNRWMTKRIEGLAGVPLLDSQCGFRLLDLAVWERMQMQMKVKHFEVESQLITEVVRLGAGIAFVPIQVIYGAERSKIRPAQDSIRWLVWWMRERRRGENGKMNKEV